MSLEIKKIQLHELEGFVNSSTFQEFEHIPISPIRAVSYLKNPHAQPNDTVLYLGFRANRLVAFRSLFADVARSADVQIRFAWCSGAWVHPDFRRKGFSERLLMEAYFDWDKKLMFTNYSPASKKLIERTNLFKPIHQFEGIRAYLFPKTRKLVRGANSNLCFKLLFSFVDAILSFIAGCRTPFFSVKNGSEITFETLEFPDKQCYQSIKNNKHIFQRDEQVFKWIFSWPWISDGIEKHSKNYPFSSYSTSFYYKTIKVVQNRKFLGFFIFSVREGHLKTLFFNLPDGLEDELSVFFKSYCKKYDIEVATIYKKEVADKLFQRKFPFLHTKKYGQNIYSTFEISTEGNLNFQDGDGDVIFT